MSSILRVLALLSVVGAAHAAGPAAASAPEGKQAKVCTTCHKTVDPGTMRGHFDEFAPKARSIQVKIDADYEVLSFDPRTLKLANAPEAADVEKALQAVRKGAEVRVVYSVENGVKRATELVLKPKLQVAPDKVVTTAELERLVAAGPEKGKYALFDARPAARYADGYIATAESLPFPAFEKEKGKLPADKSTLVIFYCAGVTCAMSPAARDAAQSLGYVNAKIYHEGIPVWTKAHPLALTPKLLKEAWHDKQQPLVLLDARRKPAGGVLPGAVAFPDASKASLDRLYKLRKLKPPIVVYDDGAGADAARIAGAIVKEGYVATVLTGGVAAWKAAGYALAEGAPAEQLVFVPKPKPGAIPVAEFKALAAETPSDTVLLDVRNPDEVAGGAFRGAVNIPADQLAGRTAELPKEKRIVAHCSTGTRAEMAYHVLQGAGFTRVAFLDASVEFEGGKALVGE